MKIAREYEPTRVPRYIRHLHGLVCARHCLKGCKLLLERLGGGVRRGGGLYMTMTFQSIRTLMTVLNVTLFEVALPWSCFNRATMYCLSCSERNLESSGNPTRKKYAIIETTTVRRPSRINIYSQSTLYYTIHSKRGLGGGGVPSARNGSRERRP